MWEVYWPAAWRQLFLGPYSFDAGKALNSGWQYKARTPVAIADLAVATGAVSCMHGSFTCFSNIKYQAAISGLDNYALLDAVHC